MNKLFTVFATLAISLVCTIGTAAAADPAAIVDTGGRAELDARVAAAEAAQAIADAIKAAEDARIRIELDLRQQQGELLVAQEEAARLAIIRAGN